MDGINLHIRHPETMEILDSDFVIDTSNESPNATKHFTRMLSVGDLKIQLKDD